MNPISPSSLSVIPASRMSMSLLAERKALGLDLLHFHLAALDLSHDNQRVLKLIDLLLEVHS